MGLFKNKISKVKIIASFGIVLSATLILTPIIMTVANEGTAKVEFEKLKSSFQEGKDKQEILSFMSDVKLYNEVVSSHGFRRPIDSLSSYDGEKELDPISFLKGKPIMTIDIPKIDLQYPVYYGIGDNNLSQRVVLLDNTYFPGSGIKGAMSVITAHRDTAQKKLFRDVPDLVEGDEIFITTELGEYKYKVYKIMTITPTEADKLVPDVDRNETVVLLTCTPYLINSHRFLAFAELVEE